MRGPKGPLGWNAPETATPYRHELHMPTQGLPKTSIYHPGYSELPECIKSSISDKDYNSMPDELKRTLIHDMTHPEVEED